MQTVVWIRQAEWKYLRTLIRHPRARSPALDLNNSVRSAANPSRWQLVAVNRRWRLSHARRRMTPLVVRHHLWQSSVYISSSSSRHNITTTNSFIINRRRQHLRRWLFVITSVPPADSVLHCHRPLHLPTHSAVIAPTTEDYHTTVSNEYRNCHCLWFLFLSYTSV